MHRAPLVFAVSRTQGASACLPRGSQLEWAIRTGVAVPLNTWFNGKDKPIVATPAEALDTFRKTPMHTLVMPPFVLRKRVAPEGLA